MEKHKETLLFACGLIIGLWALWQTMNVFLLAFAAILLAILLYALGSWTRRLTHLPFPLALLSSLIVFFGVVTLIFWLYAPLIAEQFQTLMAQLPSAAASLRKALLPVLDSPLLAKTETQFTSEKILSQLVTIFSFTLGSIVSFFVFLIVGLYFALTPETYRHDFLGIFSPQRREKILSLLETLGHALKWWLLGKVAAMVFVGFLSFLGLWFLGVQLAFILGLVAALLTFIPYLGPILASVPAILIAYTQDPIKAFYVIALYLLIHGVEGYFLTPMIEQKTVSLPPALTILAQVLFAVLFGALGIVLATPLAVVAVALLKTRHRVAST